jgi:hypothetical protein
MLNLNLLLTVASDINSVLFALFNPVFVPIFVVSTEIYIFQYKLQIRLVLELNRLAKFMRVGFSQQPNLKM